MSQWPQRLTSRRVLQHQRCAHLVRPFWFPAKLEKSKAPHFHQSLVSTPSTPVCVDIVVCMVVCGIRYNGRTDDHCQWGCNNLATPSSSWNTHHLWWSRTAHKLHHKHADKSNFHPAVPIHLGCKSKTCFVKSNVSALCLLHSFVPCQSAQRAAKAWNHHYLSTQYMHWNHRPHRNVSSLHASINQKVQHIIHLFHCAIRIPSRWKVTTENSEPPGNQREMQAADPFPICMEGHMCNLCGEFGRNANSNTLMIGTTALQNFDNDMHTVFNLISIIRCKWGRFVITIPCCRLSAIRKTTIVQSLLHVCNEILHCFLHHCRHIAGIIPIDSQVVLHKSDGINLPLSRTMTLNSL